MSLVTNQSHLLKPIPVKHVKKQKKRMSELISEKTTGKLAKVDLLCLYQSTSTSTVTTSIQDENMLFDTDLDYELLSASQSDMVLNDIQLSDDDGLDTKIN